MRKPHLGLAILSVSALSVLTVAACSSSSSGSGDDSSNPNDSGATDATTLDGSSPKDSGGGVDSGVDSGPPCTATPCVLSIAAGANHTCALLADKTVRCWGGNEFGETGQGVVDSGITYPTKDVPPTAVSDVTGITGISAGGVLGNLGLSCAVGTTGTLQCWGNDQYGQLGVGDAAVPSGPTPTLTLATNVTSVSSGAAHECVVLNTGAVSCWGSNYYAETGRDSGTPSEPTPSIVPVPGGVSFTQVSASLEQTCAVTTDGHVWCWGINQQFALGHDHIDGGVGENDPAQVAGISGVKQVASGLEGACVVTTAGGIECWGYDIYGALGRNDVDGGDAAVADYHPQPVAAPSGVTFTEVTPVYAGYCALASDQTVWCWGANVYGELAQGTVDDAGTGVTPQNIGAPTKVPGLTGVTQVAGNSYALHACARIQDGSVKCWGYNQYGQLGHAAPDGGSLFEVTPATVTF